MAAFHDPPDVTGPPDAPDIPRRVRLYPGQWIGIPILILIPLLAMLSVFGETRATAEASDGPVHVEVDYPTRLRTGQRSEIEVRVRNLSAAALTAVTLSFDPDYFARFADVSFMPGPGAPYELELTGLGPGETSVLRIELEGDRAWRSHGRISVHHDGGAAHLPLSTFTFP